MEIFFLVLVFAIVYCYVGYPFFIMMVANLVGRTVRKMTDYPSVSVIMSVYNEEDVISAKLQNLIGLDYMKEKIEVLIGSDASTDKTNVIIEGFRDSRIKLFKNDSRRGKPATLNELVQKAKGDVLVFCDARQKFAPDAVRQLVANFTDKKVGCVSGELMFSQKENATAKGVNLYWSYEKFIRSQESRVHSMLGATGAIYAVRRQLYSPIPTDIVLDDMYVPLKIVQKGYRAVFDETAKAYDEVADSPQEEHRRKTRTLYGNFQIFAKFSGMFIPLRSPIALQFFSHKFLRVVMPFCLMAVFLFNILLLEKPFYQVLFVLQMVFYGMAVLGAAGRYADSGILKVISKICYAPYVFCLLNFSALIGFLRFVGSKQDVMWDKARAK